MSTTTTVLNHIVVGLEAADAVISDPKVSAVTKGAATLVRLIAAITEDRSTEEAIAILERVRDHGTSPITSTELDAQLAATLAKAHRDE